MNRGLLLGLLAFFALLGISLVGGDNLALAGHGCHGCAGVVVCDGAYACAGVPCGGVVVDCGCAGVAYQRSYAPVYCGGCAGNACGGVVACGGIAGHRGRLFGRMRHGCAGSYPVVDPCGCAGYTVVTPMPVIEGPIQKMGPVQKYGPVQKAGTVQKGGVVQKGSTLEQVSVEARPFIYYQLSYRR